jgi:hypothetical protein
MHSGVFPALAIARPANFDLVKCVLRHSISQLDLKIMKTTKRLYGAYIAPERYALNSLL